ncbi:MAG: ATP-binding protein [Verrucomicrobiales bacterium]|nr:ATP-binding protein [Verrucomicrobiales bacterium]
MMQFDDSDEIWVITEGGVGAFSPASGESNFYEVPSGESLRDFAGDSNGILWISTDKGLLSFSAEHGSWRELIASPVLSDPQEIISDLKSSDTLWISDAESGLVRFSISGESGEVYAPAPESGNPDLEWGLSSLCQTPDGRIWAGGKNGLLRVEEEGFEWITFKDRALFPNCRLTAISANAAGDRLWVGTESERGLLSFDCNRSEWVSYGGAIRAEHSRGVMKIRDVLVDHFGVLWMVTEGFGLVRTNSLSDSMLMYASITERKDSLFPGLVLGSFESGDHILVHSSSGLARISQKSREITRIRFGSNSGRGALAMGQLSETKFLLVTPQELILNELHQNGRWDRIDAFPIDFAETVDYANCAAKVDGNGRLWFSIGFDLFRFDPVSTEVTKVATLPSRVRDIYAHGKDIWVGHRGGIYRFNLAGGEPGILNFGENVAVRSMVISDEDPHLWAATNSGLFVCDPETMEVERVSGFVQPMSSVCQGPEGMLWLVVDGNLELFEMRARDLADYSWRSELFARPFQFQSVQTPGDGRILVGGYGILMDLSEKDLCSEVVLNVPELRLQRVEVLGEENEREIPVHGNQFPDEIVLKASDHGIRLHATIPDYQFPSANYYEYRVDGDYWSRCADGIMEISRISKGTHTIELRAVTSRGVTSGTPVSISLHARPRLWETAGFYVIISLVSLIAVALHFRWRTRILSRAKETLEAVNEALTDSESRYRGIVTGTTDAIVITDTEFQIVACNPAAERILGAVIGEDFAGYGITPEVIPDFVGELKASGIHSDELLVRGNAENIVRVEATVIGDHGDASQWQFQMRDITSQVEWEARIREAQKMDAVGTLAGGIAHDFNNLLTPIAVHSKLSREALENNAEAAVPGAIDAFRICSDAAARAAELVQSLLRFAKQTDEGARVEDLVLVMKSAGRLLRGSLSTNVDLDIETDDRPARVYCSAQQFEQCLMNLVVNAGHAIGIGNGKIRVTLRRVAEGTPLPPEAAKHRAGIWCLSIVDDGEGMDEATRRKIFDPFFTTRAPGDGSGLGLSMVHSFVGEFGCGLEVESEPGEGTTFRVYFPEAPAEVSVKAPEPVDSGRGSTQERVSPRRLLVVDDDPRVLLATTMMLRKLGHEVVSKVDPVEALDLFQSDQRFDLVITDQMMPEITGIRLAQKIHEIAPEIPVILLTGFSQLMLEQGDHGEDISIVHMKPLDYGELNGSLQRYSRPLALADSGGVALSS